MNDQNEKVIVMVDSDPLVYYNIQDYFKNAPSENQIPFIVGSDWDTLTSNFTKEQIKEGFAEYITFNNIPFPYREIDTSEVQDKFNNLKNISYSDFIMNDSGEVVEKYNDYKYPFSSYGKFVISFGHYHNDISNYYQQKNRYDCSSYTFNSPNEIWKDKNLLTKMNWTFWRFDVNGINIDKIRGSFRLGSYVATQFKPHVAKTIYDYVASKTKSKTKSTLDISMGWGDRLAGFYTSKMNQYVGFDPNPTVFEVYKTQCKDYELLLSGEEPVFVNLEISVNGKTYNGFHCKGKSGKEVYAYNAPAEEMLDIIRSNSFDCIFTSPPYFSTEKYSETNPENQSWFKYPEYDNWWNNFLKPVMTACYESLKDDGVMMINIMDPTINGTRYKTCDQLVDHIVSVGGHFDGQVGMRIKQRPKNIDPKSLNKHLLNTFIENIWCFSKNKFDLSFKHATLETLFGD